MQQILKEQGAKRARERGGGWKRGDLVFLNRLHVMFLCEVLSVISAAVVIVAFVVQERGNIVGGLQRGTTVPLTGRKTRPIKQRSFGLTPLLFCIILPSNITFFYLKDLTLILLAHFSSF